MIKIISFLIIISITCQAKTFDEAYSEFLNYNLSIQQYLLKKEQAKLQVSQTVGKYFPQLYATFQREHNDLQGSRQASATTDFEESLLNHSPTNARRAKMTLSQTLFNMSLNDELTLKDLAVQQANLEAIQAIQEGSIEFVTTFYTIAKSQYMKRVLGERISMYETVIKDLDSKQLVKLTTLEETFSVRMDQLKTIEEELLITKELHLAVLDYHRLLNISPIDHDLIFDVPKISLSEIEEFNPIDGITFAYNNRADLMVLNHQINVLETEKSYKTSTFKPEINLSTSYGMTNEDTFKFDLQEDRDFSWSFDITVPIFDGFNSNAINNEYKLAIEETLFAIDELRNKIRRDTTEALIDINIAKITYLNNVKRTKYQRERLRLIKIKKDVNQAVESDVSIIRSNYKQAEVDERVSAIDLIQKIVIYYLRIGKVPLENETNEPG